MNQILVALDVSTARDALALADTLRGTVGGYKVGSQLFTSEGPSVVRALVERGDRVFLDLKFHDIPNTVKHAAAEAAKLGVSMMTIHTSGGPAMMQAVTTELRQKFGNAKPTVLGVTVLTSLDDQTLNDLGINSSMDVQVLRMARLAENSGLDGVVCSPREIRTIRSAVAPEFKIVTPGIRMPGQSADDQQRTATPREAIAAGADYIVVGRTVTNAASPREALQAVLQGL